MDRAFERELFANCNGAARGRADRVSSRFTEGSNTDMCLG